MSQPRKRPPLAVLVMRLVREHGPLTHAKLTAIGRSIRPEVGESSWRGRCADLVGRGEIEKVGTDREGHSIFDVKGIRRKPKTPTEQRIFSPGTLIQFVCILAHDGSVPRVIQEICYRAHAIGLGR